MTTIDSTGKVAYVYNEQDDKWYPLAGYASTTVPYSWSGTHEFTNTVDFNSVLNAKAGVNNFQNPSDRDEIISSPTTGTVVFVQQTDDGQILNQIQYWHLGAWRVYGENAQLISKTTSTNLTLSLNDAGRTIDINSPTSVNVEIPANTFLVGTQIAFIQTGAGQVVFTPLSGVTLLSKGYVSPTVVGNRKIAAQYSPATLIQKSANVWILIGDLTK
jgi:hypothetical protein